jgi:hypothetical protein
MTRKASHICVLSDGRRIRYSLQARGEFYNACFRGPDGRRKFLSTKERTSKLAEDAACVVIHQEYEPKPNFRFATWDEALAEIKQAMKAKNLRPRTITSYEETVTVLRKVLPPSHGPADITLDLARRFRVKRMEDGLSPVTVAGDINTLCCIWSKWFIEECDLVSTNPWTEVEKPKVDEPEPRYIEPAEQQDFFNWLLKRWDGWRLPVLFFTVKGLTGRRMLQLCSLPKTCLHDGRIVFVSDANKGRRMEYAKVPVGIFKELNDLAGPTWLWESYTSDLRAYYTKRKRRDYFKEFTPARLKRWLQNQVTDYNAANKNSPGFVPFTAHNFRDTAMTQAWDADIPVDKAAIAFGCNVETMKKHYIRKDRLAEADSVFARIEDMKANGSPAESTANKLLTSSSETTKSRQELGGASGTSDGNASQSHA